MWSSENGEVIGGFRIVCQNADTQLWQSPVPYKGKNRDNKFSDTFE